jgi:cysteinyl-tRNA synthetase
MVRTLASLSEYLAKLSHGVRFRRRNRPSESLSALLRTRRRQFDIAAEEDFNTPRALAVLFETVRATEENLWNYTARDAAAMRGFLEDSFASLGLRIATPRPALGARIVAAVREIARRRRKFAVADWLRGLLGRLGYAVEDTPAGAFLQRRK